MFIRLPGRLCMNKFMHPIVRGRRWDASEPGEEKKYRLFYKMSSLQIGRFYVPMIHVTAKTSAVERATLAILLVLFCLHRKEQQSSFWRLFLL